MPKREICLLNDSFPPIIDGVANTVVNYGKNLTAMGDGVSVITPDVPGAKDEGYPYPVIRYPSVDARKLTGYTVGIPLVGHVMEGLGERKVELFHAHCPVSSLLMARGLREKMDAPIVMTYHTKFDRDIADGVSSKVLQEGAIKALVANVRAADEVWVVSEGAGENLRGLGYEGDYVVMENGVDVPKGRLSEDRTRELTQGHDIPEGVPVFLFVGRMMWYKGQRIIIDALSALKYAGYDFRMMFIGKGLEMEEIKAYAKEKNLERECIFTGPIYDREVLTAWYCRADLFLFPSTYDTNGLVVREAAACSLGSVLVRGSCAAEGVTDGKNGLFIEEDATSLAICLTWMLEHRERFRPLGEAAADDLYISWETAVKRAAERYEIVIDNYKSGVYDSAMTPSDELFKMEVALLDWRQKVREKFHSVTERGQELADRGVNKLMEYGRDISDGINGR